MWPPFLSAEMCLAAAIGLAASVEDLWRRKVSNWIPLAAVAAGLVCHSWQRGWTGLGAALLGLVGGFGIFLVFYLLGGMGGGDVKLMAGLGTVVAIDHLLEAALWTAILGALLALAVLAMARLRRLIDSGAGRVESIPYAPAIAIGACLALVPR